MPSAATSPAASPARARASRATASCDSQISRGSCSTQPGCGKICRSSRWAAATAEPESSKTMARELVVPWSRARTKGMAGDYTVAVHSHGAAQGSGGDRHAGGGRMHEIRSRRRVEFVDTDMSGIMHFSRYLVFMENTEHAFLAAIGA